nr:hypothetical protein [Tanacetum cinerariifolium]
MPDLADFYQINRRKCCFLESVIDDGVMIAKVIELSDSIENARGNAYPRGPSRMMADTVAGNSLALTFLYKLLIYLSSLNELHRPPSPYMYLGDCKHSWQHCEALFGTKNTHMLVTHLDRKSLYTSGKPASYAKKRIARRITDLFICRSQLSQDTKEKKGLPI